MNIYFLVEGRRTESKIYPRWLKYLIPKLTRVDLAHNVQQNNYFLFSGEGWPNIKNHLKNAFEEINTIKKFQYLVICVDAEELSVAERQQEFQDFITENQLELPDTKLIWIIQNRCIETWLLGNRKVFKRNPQNEDLREYIEHYNVYEDDPELMPTFEEYNHAQFHEQYLKKMLLEKNIRYSKKNPTHTLDQSYLDELIKRTIETQHLKSFRYFLHFCEKINNTLNQNN